MAFENVFGNVDFRVPERKQARDQAQFMQMLGMGIQKQQFEQQMDMKERQMEAKGSEFNLKRAAETALLKRNMGFPTTPQEDAAIQTMGQIAPPTYSTDNFGNVVSRPSGWGSVGGTYTGAPVSDAPNWSGARPSDNKIGDTGYGQGSNPAMTSTYDQISPAITMEKLMPMDAASVEDQLQGTPIASQSAIPPQGRLPETPNYDASPVGEIDAGKAKTGVAQYAAEKGVDQLFAEQKEQREKLKGMPKQEKRIIESAFEWKGTSDVLNEAIEMVSPFSAGVGSLSSIIPATPARNLTAKLNTIKADSAFGALQKMRDNSKTGGALGQVSERELSLLESAQAPLDQAQSPNQLIEALQDYQGKRTASLKRVADAFEKDYGRRPKQIDDLLKATKPKQKPTPEQIRAELKRRGL